MISALEHYDYCPRQCALIHVEQTFDENIYTLRGRAVHERVDALDSASREGVRTEYGVPLWSEELGLVGKSDAVEFEGKVPYPIEYKRGSARKHGHADVQLAAQAMCLEEMLGVAVPAGAVFYHASRRRTEVPVDAALRTTVCRLTARIREMLAASELPPPVNDARCTDCSLVESCLPSVVADQKRVLSAEIDLFETSGE